MFDKEKWSEVFQVLSKNPFRTLATAFGVIWGLMMLIIMIGSGKGLENGVTADFNRVTNSMFLWSQSTTKAHAGFKKGRQFDIRYDDVAYLKEHIPEIDIISPRTQLGGYRGSNNVVRGIKTGAYSVYGDTPDYEKIESRPIEYGRFINWSDLANNRKVCVIGLRVYRELFDKGEDAIGKFVKISGVNFQVVGVYTTKLKGERAEEDTKSIFMPITTFQKAFNWGDIVGWLSITSQENVPVAIVEEKVLKTLKERHKIHPDDDRAFGYFNLERQFKQMNGIFTGIRGLSWFVGVLTLFAGIIGVSNIMLVTIKERTNEIGVRKALGATPWNIVSQILLESLFLSAIAGFFGVILGVWMLEGVALSVEGSDGAFRNPGVDFNVIFSALVVLIFSGVLSGLLPAMRAVKIKPVEALRTE
ncbi:MAG TPA: ABC transporter permease [Cryomorphaceae bacterium]|nr:ABC transporter permease [Cryomorphaceae bacterium]